MELGMMVLPKIMNLIKINLYLFNMIKSFKLI
jgi:hypothetical protein